MPSAAPIQIRGVDYPSMRAAAEALGVTHGAIWQALEKGRLERVGLGIHGNWNGGAHLRKPCWFRGKHYPSRAAAARAHGLTVSAVCQSVKYANGVSRQMAA